MAIDLTGEIEELVNGALAAGNPMIVAVVDAEGRPRLSFRGSIQVFGKDALGFWARNPEGQTVRAIEANSHVAFMLRYGERRTFLQFSGRARTAAGEEGERVYAAAPKVEQDADPEKRGVGVIVDVDKVEGLLGLGPDGQRRFVRMTRE